MRTPASVLHELLVADSATPRVTCYDDEPGITRGERVELSARVFANWVSKAANALQDEWDVEPGGVVRLDLRPHWRSLYWAFAVWSVGATVDLVGADEAPDLVVTDEPDGLPGPGTPAVLVSRAALARRADAPVPAHVLDEAAQLATFPDAFTPYAEPDGADLALVAEGVRLTYADLVDAALAAAPGLEGARAEALTPTSSSLLTAALAAWARAGSLVVHLGTPAPETLARRRQDEGVDPAVTT